MTEFADPADKSVGIEVSVASLRAVCLGPGGEIAETATAPFAPNEGTLPQLESFISGLKEKFGTFDRVGIAIPGLVWSESGRVAYSAHIPEHSAIDLADEIEKSTGIKAVVENDANAAAYGELKLGAGRGEYYLSQVAAGIEDYYTGLGAGDGLVVVPASTLLVAYQSATQPTPSPTPTPPPTPTPTPTPTPGPLQLLLPAVLPQGDHV